MAPPPSPTVASWELSRRLRQRREQLGIEVSTITDALGFSRNYWSAVENERKILSEEKLGIVVTLFELDREEQDELFDLRETARHRGWWARYSALFSNDLLRVYGMEHGAQGIRTYESLLIPGLLQTEDYARALISSDIAVIPKVEVDQRVQVRMRRQRRLAGDDPLQLTAVISEAALLQQIGGAQVLHDQLVQLARVIEEHSDTIDVLVLPFASAACGVFGASTFHLIDFASPRLPTLAWQETVTAWGLIEDEDPVRDMSLVYAEALQRTLGKYDSLDLIRRYSKGM